MKDSTLIIVAIETLVLVGAILVSVWLVQQVLETLVSIVIH